MFWFPKRKKRKPKKKYVSTFKDTSSGKYYGVKRDGSFTLLRFK